MQAYNSQLVVSSAAIRHNYAAVQAALPRGTVVIPVLKADAYGLGAVAVARALLAESPGIPLFAVAQVSEAATLRGAGITQDILLLSPPPAHALAAAVDLGVTLPVFRPDMVAAVAAETARQGKSSQRVQVKIDTGLHRYGAQPGPQLAALANAIKAHPGIVVTGVFSHFSCGEQQGSGVVRGQLARFHEGVAQLNAAGIETPLRHIAASGAVEWLPDAALDAVRIGRRLYLDASHLPGAAPPTGGIQPAFTWRSSVVHTQRLAPGESVGYGGCYTVERETDVAVVCVGLGDGLAPELAAAHAPVLAGGKPARLLAACMDACFIDVTGLDTQPGDEVVFYGTAQNGAHLCAQQVAALIGCEGVDLTSKLTQRVERVIEE